jgi:glycosyltransferase involved in cell wall biosynthesis
MQPMRILQVVATLAPRTGGPSIACPELSRELVRQGHQVSIYASDVDGGGHLKVPLDRPVLDDGVEIRYFRGLSWPGKYMFSPGMWRALRETVADFDVVHIYSVYGFSSSAAAYWCRERAVPYLVHPHGSLDPFLRRRHRPRKWLHAKLLAERDYRKAAGALFNSAEEMRLASDWPGLKTRWGGAEAAPKRFVVPVGIDPRWLQEPDAAAGERFRSKYSAMTSRRLVVYFGRINFKKGLDILARAFAQVAGNREDLHLVLAGPDTEGYGRRVRGWLAEGGVLAKATFTGLLQGEDRFAALQQAEVFALPSYTENFGQVVAEAMACGVPVVISDQVNIWPEVMKANGGLVVPCDAEATAQALHSLLADPARGRQMGSRGRRWVAEHLTWKIVAAQMASAYEEMVRDHDRNRACLLAENAPPEALKQFETKN